MNIRENRRKGCRTYYYGTEYFKRPSKRGIRIFAYKTGCSKSTYITQIGFVDWRKGLKSSIWVHCSCDYFKYNVEYVLSQLGASELVFSWNQPPHIRNPKYVPHACKHILLIVDDALAKAKTYGRKDLEEELQEVDVDKIAPDEFNPKDLTNKNRFKDLQKPSTVFKPYTQPATQNTGQHIQTPETGNPLHPYTQSTPLPGLGNPENIPTSPFSSIPRNSASSEESEEA
jgi:hypothetical protein